MAILKNMLERDPEKRLSLLALMDMDYYKWDDEVAEHKINEVLSMTTE